MPIPLCLCDNWQFKNVLFLVIDVHRVRKKRTDSILVLTLTSLGIFTIFGTYHPHIADDRKIVRLVAILIRIKEGIVSFVSDFSS